MPLKLMHLLDSCMLEAYRDKILLEWSFYSQKTTDIPFFSATSSKNRLKFFFSKISFDDFETRTEHWEKDRFAAIRNIFEKFDNNCRRSIIPDEFVSIDETLYPMRIKVVFKQFNPIKPDKCGLLFKSINASCYPYSFV